MSSIEGDMQYLAWILIEAREVLSERLRYPPWGIAKSISLDVLTECKEKFLDRTFCAIEIEFTLRSPVVRIHRDMVDLAHPITRP
jgi:hypothetical protein